MAPQTDTSEAPAPEPGAGQMVLEPAAPILAPSEQVRHLYRLTDPALSELGLEQLLDELLARTRHALDLLREALCGAGDELL
jgi:hypothetical protein